MTNVQELNFMHTLKCTKNNVTKTCFYIPKTDVLAIVMTESKSLIFTLKNEEVIVH